MPNEPLIAWTRVPRDRTMDLASASGVRLIVMPALDIEPTINANDVRDIVNNVKCIVVTSATTVDILIAHGLIDIVKGKSALVVGKTTAVRLAENGADIRLSSSSAEDFRSVIAAYDRPDVLHLGGDHVAVELGVRRLSLYRTIMTGPLLPPVTATAFFSPRGVRSVLLRTPPHHCGLLCAIGQTTARAVQAATGRIDIVSDYHDETRLLRAIIDTLRRQSAP